MKRCFKFLLFCFLIFQLSASAFAQQNIDSLNITIPFTVYKSVGDTHSIEELIAKHELFQTSNIASNNNNRKDAYCVRAELNSLLPILQKDTLGFLRTADYCNATYYIQYQTTL